MLLQNKIKQLGFTLIELVIVIVILGILAAIAIPKYVDLSSTALTAAKKAMSGAAKSALAISIAEDPSGTYPTLTGLSNNLQGASVMSGPPYAGLVVTIDSTTYLVPTYTNTGCTAATILNANTVKCVGDIA